MILLLFDCCLTFVRSNIPIVFLSVGFFYSNSATKIGVERWIIVEELVDCLLIPGKFLLQMLTVSTGNLVLEYIVGPHFVEANINVFKQMRYLFHALMLLGINFIVLSWFPAKATFREIMRELGEAILTDNTIAVHYKSANSIVAKLAEIFGDFIGLFLHLQILVNTTLLVYSSHMLIIAIIQRVINISKFSAKYPLTQSSMHSSVHINKYKQSYFQNKQMGCSPQVLKHSQIPPTNVIRKQPYLSTRPPNSASPTLPSSYRKIKSQASKDVTSPNQKSCGFKTVKSMDLGLQSRLSKPTNLSANMIQKSVQLPQRRKQFGQQNKLNPESVNFREREVQLERRR